MNWLLLLISFVSLWCIGFFLHEIGHILGAYLTGGKAKIRFWLYKGIPSMKVYPEGDYNRFVFLWSGGLFAGIIYSLLSFIPDSIYLWYPLYVIGGINLVYSSYEVCFLDVWSIDKYMKYHYLLYAVVFFIFNLYLYLIKVL